MKPQGSVGGVMRFTTDTSPGTSTEFTYQVKIVLMGQDVNNEGTLRRFL